MSSPCQCSQKFGARVACHRNITDLAECAATTKKEILSDLEQLNLSYVDLILLHGPNEVAGHDGGCGPEACAANLAQWQVYMEMYKAGKARAIGVGNFCPTCFDCLLANEGTLVPSVNQVQYHVAYGADPKGFMSYFHSKGIVPHVYEPLATGVLASNALCASIGKKRNKTAAQVAMRWVSQNPIVETAILTSSTDKTYLEQDIDIFDWDLSADELKALDAINCTTNPELCKAYDGREAWGCTK
jgi:2,5-diketo-D-gluconate reductase A